MKIKYFYFNARMKYYILTNKSREYINKKYYECFFGVDRKSFINCAYKWYEDIKKHHSNIVIPEIFQILQNHLDSGDEVVFVSGSSVDILAPFAKDMGVKHILATNMKVVNDKYTGEILFPQTIGEGKKIIIQMFMKNQGDKIGHTYAYGDDYSDIPMLSAVDFPNVISGDFSLDRYADEKKWKKIIIGRVENAI